MGCRKVARIALLPGIQRRQIRWIHGRWVTPSLLKIPVPKWALSRKLDKKVPSITIAGHAIGQVLLVSIPFLIAGCPKKIVWSVGLEDVGLYLVLCMSSLNQVFIVRSLQIGPQLKASIVSLMRVVFMVLAGVVLFSEEITWAHGVGGVMLMASIVLVMYRGQK